MTETLLTPTQAARQEWLERETAQLLGEGVPQQWIDAYKDPAQCREAWDKHQREEREDPAVRRQQKESDRVEMGSGGAARGFARAAV